MNVEFRCPLCNDRMMHPPAGGLGSVIRRTCKNPNCVPGEGENNRYVQTERWGEDDNTHLPVGRKNPRFDFVENEDGKQGSRAGQGAPLSVEGGGTVGSVLNQDELMLGRLGQGEEAKNYLRTRIHEITGEAPDGRLGFNSLREELFDALDAKSPLPAIDTSMRDGTP